ncbi:cob(I)yrinic acid a,c-diamide adenosyltransferase [uncultured Porphyromonas sp.]|uniref:cob(I)yrinic acid a,c-diamide adenosyltransferase n=1 Tax=uncultured Porphyromonas sp. TaxID=159274 RepID=UPI0026236B25|nr:cob(I)yrinic acid a,c-diamide adenosyltransferase [uncultured Porphyromonas sp.]
MKKSPVYTRRGDDGTTGLVGGTRISKGHIRLECYGTIDELNSHIGVLLAEELTDETHDFLLRLQHILFNVAGSLATPPDQEEYLAAMQIDPTDIEKLEHKIDELDATLPRLKEFVLPSGGRSAALCHVCRTVCRRAERNIYRLREESRVDDLIVRFVNRLSDYFFVLARTEAVRTYGSEVTWNRGYSTL